jgi:hypothetical protein
VRPTRELRDSTGGEHPEAQLAGLKDYGGEQYQRNLALKGS